MPGLRNKTIAITRSEQDAREFFELVESEGGRAVAYHRIYPSQRDAEEALFQAWARAWEGGWRPEE